MKKIIYSLSILLLSLILNSNNLYSQNDLKWAKSLILHDEATEIEVDSLGNIYTAGISHIGGFVIYKYSPLGNTLWVTNSSTTQYLYQATDMILDKYANIYVIGGNSISSSNGDYFIMKCSTSGTILWETTYNGIYPQNELPNAIDIDEWGNVYVTGKTKGSTGNFANLTVKLNPSGTVVWASMGGIAGYEAEGSDIFVLDSNNIYVTGYTSPTWNSKDIVTVKYNSIGDTVWTRRYNHNNGVYGGKASIAKSIQGDAIGNIYVVGSGKNYNSNGESFLLIKYNYLGDTLWMYSQPIHEMTNNYHTVIDDSANIYVIQNDAYNNHGCKILKIDSNGSLIWSNDINYYYGRAISIDLQNNVYVAGRTGSNSNTYLITFKIDHTGTLHWQSNYPAYSHYSTESNDIAVDKYCNFYVAALVGNGSENYGRVLKYSLEPVADFNFTSSISTYSFTDTSKYATNWYWDFGDGSFSTDENPTHTYIIPDNYNVCLTASNGCIYDTKCQSIFVACAPPISNFNYINSMLNISFNDQSLNASKWKWDFGDGFNDTIQNPVHIYTQYSNYQVRLICTNDCGTDTIYKLVDVICLPIANFNYSISQLNVFFNDSSINYSSRLWDFGDGFNDTIPNPVHTYAQSGTYQACLICSNTCGSDTVYHSITVLSNNITNPQLNDKIFIYPNPTNDFITIDCPNATVSFSIIIFDVEGRKLREIKHQSRSKYDLSNFKSGLYIIKIFSENKFIRSEKLIVKP